MSTGTDDLASFPSRAIAKWGTVQGLLYALVVCLVISLGVGEGWSDRLIAFAILSGAASFWWSFSYWDWWGFWKRNEIRFVVGIYCDEISKDAQIEEDFTKELRSLIRQGHLGKTVKLIKASRAECMALEASSDYENLLRKKGGHILVYGRVRARRDEAGDALFVNLRAGVRHAAVQEKLQAVFCKEISSVFPTGILKVPASEQLPQLQITADWVAVSTRYILSLAAGISGDLKYADEMLSDAIDLLPRISIDVARRTKLKERMRMRLGELKRAQANRALARWRNDRNFDHIREMKSYLEQVLAISKNDAPIKQMLATANFVLTADAVAAEKDIRSSLFDHAAPFASLAFACAMQGKYAQARKAYRDAWKRKPNADIMLQLTTFIDWFKEAYPQFGVQTLWCESQVILKSSGLTDKYKKIANYLKSHDEIDKDEKARIAETLETAPPV